MRNDSTKANVGVVGAGLMGRWHVDAIRSTKDSVLVAIADTDESRARKLATRSRGAAACSSGEELLSSQPIDILHICTPPSTHHALVSAASANGVSVLVEKPLGRDRAEVEAMVGLAREAGCHICPVHQFPFQRGFRRAVAGLASVGELLHVEMVICSAGGRGRDDVGLRELVSDVLPHPLSVAHALHPGSLGADVWRAESPRSGEVRMRGHVEGITFDVLLSMGSRPTENSVRLRCARGTWEVDLFHGFGFCTPGGVSRRRKIALPFERASRLFGHAAANLVQRAFRLEWAYPGLRALVGEFHAAVRGGGRSPIPTADIIRIADIRDRIMAEVAGSPRTTG